jgi:hypothetical protein
LTTHCFPPALSVPSSRFLVEKMPAVPRKKSGSHLSYWHR